ncbi:hypothetical protein ACLOJK_030377 [Asimina triloba]
MGKAAWEGQGMFTAKKEVGFAGLVCPPESEIFNTGASICGALDPPNITVAGKVVLCFDTGHSHSYYQVDKTVEKVKAAGGVGQIYARSPGPWISPCDDLPCVKVDFEIGRQLLSCIRSSTDVYDVAASSTDEYSGLIFADRLPLKIANPFDYGGGVVNPNKAGDPDLIYDMGMEDYIFLPLLRGLLQF